MHTLRDAPGRMNNLFALWNGEACKLRIKTGNGDGTKQVFPPQAAPGHRWYPANPGVQGPCVTSQLTCKPQVPTRHVFPNQTCSQLQALLDPLLLANTRNTWHTWPFAKHRVEMGAIHSCLSFFIRSSKPTHASSNRSNTLSKAASISGPSA